MGKKQILLLATFIFCCGTIVFFLENKKDQPVIKEESEEQFYTNLEAFGKVYGYVRYFHPSDEAADLDWNRFAIYGVEKVKKAKNEEDLRVILEKLFLPIAPTMSIYSEDGKPRKYKSSNEIYGVAWQHYGLGNEDSSLYKSKRAIAYITKDKYTVEGLFQPFPKVNEVTNEKISKTLKCSIPLVLYKNQKGTVGSNKESLADYKKLKENMVKMDPSLTSENENVRFAGIIVTWNVLNHFFPYFHVTDSDWQNQLVVSLKDTKDDKSRKEYISSLLKLMEKSKDGHAGSSFEQYMMDGKKLPFTFELIEKNVVVTEVKTDISLKPGDIILSIDEKKPSELIEQMGKEIPGSSQYKIFKAIDYLEDLNTVKLKIKRDNQFLDLVVNSRDFMYVYDLYLKEPFKEVENGVYYFNLNQNVEKVFNGQIEKLSKAKGIIFDLRGYPYSYTFMQEIIGHLTEKPVKSPISRIMQTIYPNQKNATFDERRDEIQPKKPYLNGKVVFLADAGTMSQAEYFLGFIKNNHLAQIVGQPTAGADGNIQTYTIPGNLKGTFSDMEILNADRSQTFLVGIQPDVTVTRTLDGVLKGKDEFIQKALELIN